MFKRIKEFIKNWLWKRRLKKERKKLDSKEPFIYK